MKVSVLTTFSTLALQLHKNEQLIYKQNITAERLLHFKTWLKIKCASIGEYLSIHHFMSLGQKGGKHHYMLQSVVVILTTLCSWVGAGKDCAHRLGEQKGSTAPYEHGEAGRTVVALFPRT